MYGHVFGVISVVMSIVMPMVVSVIVMVMFRGDYYVYVISHTCVQLFLCKFK